MRGIRLKEKSQSIQNLPPRKLYFKSLHDCPGILVEEYTTPAMEISKKVTWYPMSEILFLDFGVDGIKEPGVLIENVWHQKKLEEAREEEKRVALANLKRVEEAEKKRQEVAAHNLEKMKLIAADELQKQAAPPKKKAGRKAG